MNLLAEMRLDAASFSLESVYGSVKPSARPEDFKEIARIAKDEKAERVVREMMGECDS